MDIEFRDWTQEIYNVHPIRKASSVDGAHKQIQKEIHGREKFNDCPGILDYKNQGYIMTAWDDFKVYCSDNATMAYIGGDPGRPAKTGCPMPYKDTAGPMNADITDGIPGHEVKRLQPLHFDSPWTVKADNISLLILPPVYHSNIVDDFIVYPGVVDYSYKFNTLNFIMSPRRTGTFIIKAGTPIAHIIPLQKQTIDAVYGPTNVNMSSGAQKLRQGYATCKQYYRKYCMSKSKYNLQKSVKGE